MTDPVNKLVEEMAESCPELSQVLRTDFIATQMLRIVLSAVQRGEVVEIKEHKGNYYQKNGIEIVLKPEFQRFMEEK